MSELLSLAIQTLIGNPLTVSLVILGTICVGLAIVGKIPPMSIEGARALALAGFGMVLIVVAIGLAWVLAISTPQSSVSQLSASTPTNSQAVVSPLTIEPTPIIATTTSSASLLTFAPTAEQTTAIVTQIPSTVALTRNPGPFREQQTSSVGTGIFAKVTYSDGNAPYSQNELDTNHFQIYRIRPEENPDGCGVSIYNADKVWFSSSVNTVFTVNGQEIGRLSVSTGKHGYVADWPVKVGDKLCAVGYASSGFHIILGPDMYYHYDSYCYRSYC